MLQATKIIAPNHIHNYLYDFFLKRQNEPVLMGLHISTFQQIMNTDSTDSLIEFCTVYQQLQSLPLSNLQTMITYPKFVEDLLSMYQEFVKYGITTNELFEDTIIEKEIKCIFKHLDTMNLSVHQQVKSIEQLDISNYQVVFYILI